MVETGDPDKSWDPNPSLPLLTGESTDGRVPVFLTSFVGRAGDIGRVIALISREDVRLVTLTGPGGIGKTRLAARAAELAGDGYEASWFVPLASIQDAGLVGPAIARSLRQQSIHEESAVDLVVRFIGHRPALLVLDNLEQVPGAAGLIGTIIAKCPRLTILATSRSPLSVSGEHVFAVRPLPTPSPEGDTSLTTLGENESVQLLLERAAAHATGFTLTARNAQAIADICRHLDGMPLAIELAAARIDAFAPDTLRDQLHEQLAWLNAGPQDVAARLQSMRESIGWSISLLPDLEREAFEQLGVFEGAWSLDAASVVIGSDEPFASLMETVGALIRSGLVQRESGDDGEPTYRMLEPIRQFARTCLDQRPDQPAVYDRRSSFIRTLAESTPTANYQTNGWRHFGLLAVHYVDILATLQRLDSEGNIDAMAAIVSGLSYLWGMQGRTFEGRKWAERCVDLCRNSGSPQLGAALLALAAVDHMQGNEDRAWQEVTECLSHPSVQLDHLKQFTALTLAGIIALRRDAQDQAASIQRQALELLPSIPDVSWTPFAESAVLGHLGNIAVSQGNIEAATQYFLEAIARQTELGFTRGTSHFIASHPIAGLADVARAESDPATALNLYQEALDLASRVNDQRALVYALGGVAGSLAAVGDWKTAAQLFGACETYHQARGFPFDLETMDRQRALGLPEPWYQAHASFGSSQRLHDLLAGTVDAALWRIPDQEESSALWLQGAQMPMQRAISLALHPAQPRPDVRTATGMGLSPREHEVLRLVAAGRSNQDIARTLFISTRTAGNHVTSILSKLDVPTRAAAAAWAVRHGID